MFKNILLPLSAMLATAVTLVSPSPAAAKQQAMTNDYKPYFGVFTRMNRFTWERGFGNNLFRRDVPQGEIFLGTQYGQYLSFDVGYQTSATKRKLATLGGTDEFLGLRVASISDPPLSALSFVQTKGPYTHVNAILPLTEIFPSLGSNIGVLGQVGIVNLQITHRVHLIKDAVDNFDITFFNRFYKNRKVIPRLGLGVQYQPSKQTWGFRFMANWENTKRLGQLYIENNNRFRGIVKMKNAYSYGVGIFCQI